VSQEREVVVGGESRLLEEIQLSLYLRGDEGDIGDHHKKKMRKESCWNIKFGLSPLI
jgi:hypothetical protein